ncbi:MAG: ATP-binding cassette domain-containing protein, partial [Acidobacteria bacterium]
MSEKFNVLQSAMASSERIFTLLDTPIDIASPAAVASPGEPALSRPTAPPDSTRRRHQGPGRIVFDDVTFAYGPGGDGQAPVLRDVSFEVEPGQRVGIVGATGAGKTTLMSLLLRFYDVSRGRILIDGVDVREMDLHVLRGLFSLVLQDVHLFSGTIASNIRLGRVDLDDERVRRAAAAVHADRFIRSLPRGFETPVAERGATLSVGQKQLLSFARALAFDPAILFLDDATSSVDTETELLIRDALRVLMAGRTTLAIAHRLSTIQDMDKILVLHHGQLREMGSHQELLAARGIYFKLFQLQFARPAT